MIKLKTYTPDVYYRDSRDFQLLGRLYDVVLNSVKTEADLIYNLPFSDNSNDKLLELMSLTLGFKPSHQYSATQLRAICSVFPEVLKHKGSIKAIKIACNALLNAAGEEQSLDYSFTPNTDNTELNLYVPQNFNDINVLADLLTYILPAGMSCNIIKELRIKAEAQTELQTDDTIVLYTNGTSNMVYDDNKLAQLPKFSVNNASDYTTGTVKIADAISGYAKDTPGLIMNSGIFKPEITPTQTDTENNTEEEK